MNVLSVDLASKRYTDNGIVILENGQRRPRMIDPGVLGLEGKPAPSEYASALARLALEYEVRFIILDGPQGWRSPASPIPHMRLCERAVNAPGKTGTVGVVKPATYLKFIEFSIALFATLRRDHGYRLLCSDWQRIPDQLWLAESYPTAAWKTIGLKPLPAKPKTTTDDLARMGEALSFVSGLEIPQNPNHDQLQALVASLAGIAVLQGIPGKLLLLGVDPWVDKDGHVLEGLIALPRLDGGIPFLSE